MKQIVLCLFLVAVLVGCGNDDSKITVLTTTLPEATIGTPYSHTLTATGGGTSVSYIWAVTTGTLPTGLTLSTAGVISGTPLSGCGPFIVTASVYDTTTSTMQYYNIKISLPAGQGAALNAGQSIFVPDGTIITHPDTTTETVTGTQQTWPTPAGSFVSAPSTSIGSASYTVVAQ